MSTPKSSAKKSKTKSNKDDRYQDMLKKIDLGLGDDQAQTQSNEQNKILTETNNDSAPAADLKPGSVSLFDLMSSLENNDKVNTNTSLLKTHISDLTKKV